MARMLLGAAFLIGCSYPQFEFAPQADGARDTVVEDTSVEETSAIDSAALEDSTDPIDTAVDSSTADSAPTDSTMPDGSIDMGTDTGPTGCAGSTAVFCVDFDTSSMPQDGWSARSYSTGAELLLETTGAHSAPKLFVAKTPATVASVLAATLNTLQTAPSLDREARIDVWVKLESAVPAAKQIYLFKYQRDGAGDGLAFSLDSTGFFLEVNAPGGSSKRISTAVPVGKWFHVRMDAKLLYVNGSANVWIDDMTTPVVSMSGVPTLETDSLARRLAVGIYAQTTTDAIVARFDDVSLAWK